MWIHVTAVMFIQIFSSYMMYKLFNFSLDLLDDQLLLDAITSHRGYVETLNLIGKLSSNSCGPTNEEHWMEVLVCDAGRVSIVEEDSPDSRYMQSSNYPHSQDRQ